MIIRDNMYIYAEMVTGTGKAFPRKNNFDKPLRFEINDTTVFIYGSNYTGSIDKCLIVGVAETTEKAMWAVLSQIDDGFFESTHIIGERQVDTDVILRLEPYNGYTSFEIMHLQYCPSIVNARQLIGFTDNTAYLEDDDTLLEVSLSIPEFDINELLYWAAV